MYKKLLTISVAALACSSTPKTPKAQPVDAGIFSLVPASACGAFAFTNPIATAQKAKSLVLKASPGLLGSRDVLEELSEFKDATGIDLLYPETSSVTGLDLSKGVALSLDCELRFRSEREEEWLGATRTKYSPAIVFTSKVADVAQFSAFLKKLMVAQPERTIEEETWGDSTVFTLYSSYVASGETGYGGESVSTQETELRGILVIQNKTLYGFAEVNALAEQKELIAEHEANIKAFLAKTNRSIVAEPVFASTWPQIDANADIKFLLNTSKIAASLPKLDEVRYTYQTPKTEDQKYNQEQEKQYQQEREQREAEEQRFMAKIFESIPSAAFSTTIANDKISFVGSAGVAETARVALQKVFAPAYSAPMYDGLLSEKTEFLGRLTLNPQGMKDLVFSYLSEEQKKEAQEAFDEANQELRNEFGDYDLGRDILGAFAGHFSFSVNSANTFVDYVTLTFSGDTPAQNPTNQNLLFTANMVSPDAADKLLSLLMKIAALGQVKVDTQDVSGSKMYSYTTDEITIAWGHINSLLAITFSFGAEASSHTQETFTSLVQHSKTKGASFAEKLGTPLAKELATSSNASGFTLHLGSLLGYLSDIEGTSKGDREILEKAAAMVTYLTSSASMQGAAFTFKAELGLR